MTYRIRCLISGLLFAGATRCNNGTLSKAWVADGQPWPPVEYDSPVDAALEVERLDLDKVEIVEVLS